MGSKSKHTGAGVMLGAALGVIAGVLAGHIAIWLGLGIAIGVVLGSSFRREEKPCPKCAALHLHHRENEMNSKQLQS